MIARQATARVHTEHDMSRTERRRAETASHEQRDRSVGPPAFGPTRASGRRRTDLEALGARALTGRPPPHGAPVPPVTGSPVHAPSVHEPAATDAAGRSSATALTAGALSVREERPSRTHGNRLIDLLARRGIS